MIKTADWIIDLGPEGGDGGGEIVAAGTPEAIVAEKRSYTGRFSSRCWREGARSRGRRRESRRRSRSHFTLPCRGRVGAKRRGGVDWIGGCQFVTPLQSLGEGPMPGDVDLRRIPGARTRGRGREARYAPYPRTEPAEWGRYRSDQNAPEQSEEKVDGLDRKVDGLDRKQVAMPSIGRSILKSTSSRQNPCPAIISEYRLERL